MINKKNTLSPEEKISSKIWSPPGFDKYLEQLTDTSLKKKIKDLILGFILLILFCIAWFALCMTILMALEQARWSLTLIAILAISSFLIYSIVKKI